MKQSAEEGVIGPNGRARLSIVTAPLVLNSENVEISAECLLLADRPGRSHNREGGQEGREDDRPLLGTRTLDAGVGDRVHRAKGVEKNLESRVGLRTRGGRGEEWVSAPGRGLRRRPPDLSGG